MELHRVPAIVRVLKRWRARAKIVSDNGVAILVSKRFVFPLQNGLTCGSRGYLRAKARA
jgi:hypothetical protein